jgi:hypothetical protein
VGYSSLAGAISVVLVWVLNQYLPQPIPAEVAQAITVIISSVTGYVVKERAPEGGADNGDQG